jgi:hypothetical protein
VDDSLGKLMFKSPEAEGGGRPALVIPTPALMPNQ